MQRSWTTLSAARFNRTPASVALLLAVGLVALALGAVTSYAQGWLPARVGSLANSSGTWMFIAFLLALLAPRPAVAAVCAVLAFVALVCGYYAASQFRRESSSTRDIIFWLVAAVIVGPPLGVAAHWLRVERPGFAALGVALPAGVLIGEGIYGLRYIADTTYPPYWWAEICVGIALLSAVAALRLRRPLLVAFSVLATVVVAGAFVAIFSQDLLTVI